MSSCRPRRTAALSIPLPERSTRRSCPWSAMWRRRPLKLADQTLVEAGGGSILWITDSIAAEQKAPLSSWRKSSSTAVRLLPPLFPGPELDAVITGARAVNASVVRLAADDTDIRELASASKFASASGGDTNRRWRKAATG